VNGFARTGEHPRPSLASPHAVTRRDGSLAFRLPERGDRAICHVRDGRSALAVVLPTA
jgi:hypothetical protein